MTTKRPKPAVEAPVEESLALAPDGTRLYVRRRSGPSEVTAVLCDGLVCDGFIYKYLWEDLRERVSVAHWHYRGHGRSARPVDPALVSVEAHAADLNAVRAHIGDPSVVLVGHSFGTQVLLEAYRARPEKIKAMVFLCGSFGRVTQTFHNTNLLATVLPSLIDLAEKRPRLAQALWSRVPARAALRIALLTGEVDPKSVEEADMEPYFRHVVHVDFRMFLRMLSHAGEHTAEDLLPHVDVPVLVVAGDRDTFTPADISCTMAERIPGAELLLIPGATHVAPLEKKDLVAAKIAEFLHQRGIC
ncbi:MAG TPA: alpha/beta hydrolase [Polyangiaceae bacterium]|nr:alpha/beta hydrolase [Polyangiaceae bacterium]